MAEHDVAGAVAQGLSFVCATCSRWWKSRAMSLPEGCVTNGQCGGPLSSMAFPMYDGPLKGNLAHFCFVCGERVNQGVKVKDQFVGICQKHAEMLQDYSREGERPAFVTKKPVEIVK